MKTIRFFCLFLAVALLLAVSAFAQYQTVYELYEDWTTNGFPDYVAGVHAEGSEGNLVIQIVAGQEDKAAALQEQCGETLQFIYGAAYSYNELLRIQDEIVSLYMGGDGPVVGCGTGWQSVDDVVKGFGESGKEFRVVVDVLEAEAQGYAKRLAKDYGDAVCVRSTSGNYVLEDVTTSAAIGFAPEKTSSALLPFLALLFVLLAVSAIALLRRRRLQTATGQTVTEAPLSRAQTEEAVRDSAPAEPALGFEELKKRIED